MITAMKLYKNIFFMAIFLFSSQAYLANNPCIQDVTEENFKEVVEQSGLPVLVKLSATWCPNCKRLEFLMTEVLDEFKDRCVFVNIDIDKNQDFLQNLLQDIFQKHYHIIAGFPCILVFYKGVFKTSFVCFFADQQDLSKKIHEILVDIEC
jgi:thiol-disulfide isomerase/thioredoxin